MSFNLKRFRYRRNEHKTEEAALTKDLRGSAKSEPDKENKPSPEEQGTMQRQQTAEPDCRVLKTSRQTVEAAEECKASSERCTDDEGRMENGLKLQGVFPGREQKQLQEVIRSTSPLDGAVASCLKRPTEKGPSQKRKLGSLDSSDTQDSDSDMGRPRKRKKQDISKVGMSDPGKKEPSLVDQGIMVRKLQWAFPELDKEELLDLLKQHNWNIDEALDELYMSSDLEGPPSSPEAPTRELIRQKPDIPSSCLKAGPRPTTRRALKVQVAPKAKMARQKQRNWRAKKSHSSSSESESGDEFKASSDDDCKNVAQGLKARIVEFLQQASMDELSLIASCSLKKAQKIVEHRPYRSWCDLESVFHTGNSLSFDLVWGCKLVLKERQVVLELMNKCEAISSKMMKDVESLIKKGVGPSKQPTLLNRKLQLKPFQLIGLRWLNLLHQNKLSGILADEMGLGKTIQAISFLASLYQEGIKGPHLIIVPASTLDNWVRELKLWCPSLKVLVYQGPMKDRKDLRQDILSKVVDFNVIVSTYHMTIKNSNDRSLFRKLKLQYAVFDEGHMLKNMETLRYGYLMAINAKYRLLLTGTPLQNNLLELMSLLNFIMPSMFSSSTSEIAKMFSAKSLGEQSSFEKDRISRAKLIMKPFILRRVKSEVMKQLPTKEERVEFCPMSEKQQKLYSTLLEKIKRSASHETKNVLRDMMELRKMANHPLLHRQNYTDEKLATMSQLMLQEPTHHDADPVLIQEDMEVMSDFELHCLCQQYSILESYQLQTDLLLDSGKFALLTELLSSLKQKGDRVVLFSQFTMMLDILEVFLKQLGHSYVRLDGSTPIADRIVQIDKYNSDLEIFVFLLSTRAGGLGISLTTANVVILHDIDCNPYNDKQAEDRCHRVGQTRTVQVFKLVSQDTIEVDILQVSQRKLKLEQDMTAAEDGKEGDLSEDMVSLLKTSLGL